jgi:hypothetical protein
MSWAYVTIAFDVAAATVFLFLGYRMRHWMLIGMGCVLLGTAALLTMACVSGRANLVPWAYFMGGWACLLGLLFIVRGASRPR